MYLFFVWYLVLSMKLIGFWVERKNLKLFKPQKEMPVNNAWTSSPTFEARLMEKSSVCSWFILLDKTGLDTTCQNYGDTISLHYRKLSYYRYIRSKITVKVLKWIHKLRGWYQVAKTFFLWDELFKAVRPKFPILFEFRPEEFYHILALA